MAPGVLAHSGAWRETPLRQHAKPPLVKGRDVARRVRAHFSHHATIIITGDSDPDTLAQLRGSACGWPIKPIDAEELRAVASTQLANVD